MRYFIILALSLTASFGQLDIRRAGGSGSGAAITNLNANQFTTGADDSITIKSGALLTNISGAAIGTGTVADARIASTIARDTEVTSAVDAHEAALAADNPSGPNAGDGLVDWTQLINVPAGFADGTDDGSGGSSALSGTVIGSGTPVDFELPMYSDTTGTNIQPSNIQITSDGNDMTIPGDLTVTGEAVIGSGGSESWWEFTEQTAPASPSASQFRIYVDTADEQLKMKNSAGDVVRLSAPPKIIGFCVTNGVLTATTAQWQFRMPYAMTLTAVRASLGVASSSGTPTFDINEAGSTLLSTKLTIDANELTSTTAATAAVISDTALADDALITIDIDTAGTSAQHAIIWMYGY